MDTLRSKFALPDMAEHLIDRPRLREALLKNRSARLFVLKAPAGYGKSTLAVQALRHAHAIRAGWIHLDKLDNDIRRFSAQFVEALSTLFPIVRQGNLPEKLNASQLQPEFIANDILALLQEYRGLEGWLTLDNWEAVNNSADINALISSLITDRRSPLRIIITTRVRPAMRLRKFEDSGLVVILTERELGFTLLESNSVVRQISQVRIDDTQLERIWRQTKGWCVASSLVGRALNRHGSLCLDGITEVLRRSESLYEYAEEELFCDLPEQSIRFLAQCSPLETLTQEGCARILGESADVTTELERIRRSALPLTALSDSLQIRLHPLVRQAASNLLHSLFSQERVAECYRATVTFYRERGLIMEAIESALHLPDHQLALDIIDTDWFAIIAANGLCPLEDWLERFPDEIREDAKYVRTKAKLYTQQGNNQELIRYLSTQISNAHFTDDPTTRLSLWTRYQWARLNTIDEPQYDSLKSEWEMLSKEIQPTDALALAGVEGVLCVAAYSELRIDEAKTHAQRALEHVGAGGPADYRADILDNLAVLEHTSGNTAGAIEILRRNVEESMARDSHHGMPLRLFNQAWMYISSGEVHKGLARIAEGRQALQIYTPSNHYALLFANRYEGVARWLLGQQREGLRLLQESLDIANRYCPGESGETGLLLAHYHSLTRRALARGLRVPVVESPAEGGISESHLIHYAKESYAALTDEDLTSAHTFASTLLDFSATHALRPWAVTASFLLGRLANLQGEDDECSRHIAMGLATLEEIQWRLYPLANSTLTGFVVTWALRENIRIDTAVSLVSGDIRVDLTPWFAEALESQDITDMQRLRLVKAAVQLHVRGLTAPVSTLIERSESELMQAGEKYLQCECNRELTPLHIITLGEFEVIAQAQPVVISRKKSRLLLQILLTEYPGSVHEEELTETLWPESEPDKGKNALRTCVKDLRKALDVHYTPRGDSYIVYDDKGYALTLPEGSSFDAYDFEQAFESTPDASADADSDVRRALDMFTGEYLKHLRYEPFAIEKREQLTGRFLNAAARYCERRLRSDETAHTFDILKKGLQYNPLWGEGVQLLIQAYVNNKELVNAIRLYRSYEEKLQAELGVPPDEEMRAFFERIVSPT